MAKVQLSGYRCERCGHEWLLHKQEEGKQQLDPRVCPKCKSPYWTMPRKNQPAKAHQGNRQDHPLFAKS